MQTIPARLMRAQAHACKTRPAPTARARVQREYILDAAQAIFIAHGRTRVTLREIAVATGLTQISIRHHFADLDHLFALTLTRHLDEILKAIAAIPRERPDLFARRRAEYFRVTRGIFNIPTPQHFLWMRERFTLPDDELEPLELRRRMIGHMLAGDAWETALLLLDTHHLDEPEIEVLLEAQARFTEQLAEQATSQLADPPLPTPPSAERAAPSQARPIPSTYVPSAPPGEPRRPLAPPIWQAAQPPSRAPPAHSA